VLQTMSGKDSNTVAGAGGRRCHHHGIS